MAYKEIVVHLDGSKRQDQLVKAAIGFARKRDARLIGVYAGMTYELPAYVEVQLPADILDMHLKNLKEAIEESVTAFRQAAEKEGIAFDVRETEGDVAARICLHTRYADLAIIMQPDRKDDGAGARRDVVDHIVLGAGAPVLIIPTGWKKNTIGSRIIVGWDGSMQAARAGRDALPLLREAESVHVVTVGKKVTSHVPGADYAKYLAAHGVDVVVKNVREAGQPAGFILLETARDLGADLLVTGGYGHSRIGEMVLGGVTDTLLERTTIPVLMSH